MSAERKIDGQNLITLNPMQKLIESRLSALGIKPHEALGQNFLIDQSSIDILVQSLTPGNMVIEVGAGLGQITEALAARASQVTTVEIDRRFEPVLSEISKKHSNVNVIYGDILAVNLGNIMPENTEGTSVQIVANLPFHITEPFLHKVIGLPVDDITLVVGQKLVEEIQASNEDSIGFGRLSLLAQTFFDIEVVFLIEKHHILPPPRTTAAIVRFTPKEKGEFKASMRTYILKKLFDSQKKRPGVKNVIKDAMAEYTQEGKVLHKRLRNRHSRRSVRMDLRQSLVDYNYQKTQGAVDTKSKPPQRSVGELGIPESILILPFERLNNSELRILSRALRAIE